METSNLFSVHNQGLTWVAFGVPTLSSHLRLSNMTYWSQEEKQSTLIMASESLMSKLFIFYR